MDLEEHGHYSAIISNLNNNSTRLKTLNEILNSQIIDTTHAHWPGLSEALQKCFLTVNNEVFVKSLEVHYRIISFTNTSTDGFLSLQKGILGLLHNTRGLDTYKNRVVQSLKLLLHTHLAIVKILLHATRTVIDEIVSLFADLVCSKHVFELLHDLDCEGVWIRNFCYGGYIRETFFSHFRQKYSTCLKAIIKNFCQFLNNNDCNTSPYSSFVSYFLCYSYNLHFFPVKLNDENVSVEKLLEIFILKIQQGCISPDLSRRLVEIFWKQPKLLTPKLYDLLIEPLFLINAQTIHESIEKHGFVLRILSNIAESNYYRILLENPGKSRKSRGNVKFTPRTYVSLTQKLVELLLISISGKKDTGTIVILLRTCKSVYKNSIFANLSNPSKFLKLVLFYDGQVATLDEELRVEILNFVSFLYSNYSGLLDKDLLSKSDLLKDLFEFRAAEKLLGVINAVDDLETLKCNRIIKKYLDDVWYWEEEVGQEHFYDFLQFLYFTKFNTRAIIAFLSEDNEQTVVENNDKPVTLGGLIENCCNTFESETHLSLLVCKVLIGNLDLLLYLQTNYQIQEKLIKIKEIDGPAIDGLSMLRNEILDNINSTGIIANKGNTPKPTMETKAFEEFLLVENSMDPGWILSARNAFKMSFHSLQPDCLFSLLEKVPKIYVYRKIDLIWPPSEAVYYKLHPEDLTGIALIVSCGLKTAMLEESTGSEIHIDNLSLLVKQSRLFLNHKPETFVNFDWFVGVIFLFSHGDLDKSRNALVNFSRTANVSIIWSTFSQEFQDSSSDKFYQQLAVNLEEHCQIVSTLKAMGMSAEFFVRSWLRQCFFGLLDLQEIFNCIVFVILYPVEGVVQYISAIFNHIEEQLCNLITYREVPHISNVDLSGFSLAAHLESIEIQMKQCKTLHNKN